MQALELFGQFDLPISFGGAAVSGRGGGYGFGDISDVDAISLLRYAFDRGIKVYDAAPIYGFGQCEKYFGKAFSQIRERVFLTSKSGVTWHNSKRVNMTNDPIVTEAMLHQSLKDLASDYIDLYFIHWPDKNVDIRRPMEVLAKAKSQGKIKHIGLCNTNPEEIKKASEVETVEVIQAEYNFFSRYDDNVFAEIKNKKIAFMSYGTFDKGILTGSVTKIRENTHNYDSTDCRKWAPWWKSEDRDTKFKSVERLSGYLRERGHTLVEFALAFNLANKNIHSLLCGMRTIEQVESTITALDNLPDNVILSECEKFYVS